MKICWQTSGQWGWTNEKYCHNFLCASWILFILISYASHHKVPKCSKFQVQTQSIVLAVLSQSWSASRNPVALVAILFHPVPMKLDSPETLWNYLGGCPDSDSVSLSKIITSSMLPACPVVAMLAENTLPALKQPLWAQYLAKSHLVFCSLLEMRWTISIWVQNMPVVTFAWGQDGMQADRKLWPTLRDFEAPKVPSRESRTQMRSMWCVKGLQMEVHSKFGWIWWPVARDMALAKSR